MHRVRKAGHSLEIEMKVAPMPSGHDEPTAARPLAQRIAVQMVHMGGISKAVPQAET